MKILYIGDIMADPGIRIVESILPELKSEQQIDLIVGQAENVSDGKGMRPADMKRLQAAGVDFFTGGNHTPFLADLKPLLEDVDAPVVGPANMVGCPGRGWKYIDTPAGRILVVSLLGHTVGREVESKNPLVTLDEILAHNPPTDRVALVVNFHGDYSSEKVIIGHYLDGKAALVVGDHWHVPTADARILPKGTAHITDVGMCGSLDSSLGVTFGSVLPRWHDDILTRNQLELNGAMQFNAVLVDVDESTGLSRKIELIRRIKT